MGYLLPCSESLSLLAEWFTRWRQGASLFESAPDSRALGIDSNSLDPDRSNFSWSLMHFRRQSRMRSRESLSRVFSEESSTMRLATLAREWDVQFAMPSSAGTAGLRPFSKMLEGLEEIAPLRFQPYQNDDMPSYLDKLRRWLAQFPAGEQPYAFILALKLLYVTGKQMEVLERQLFECHIRRHLLEAAIVRKGLLTHDYCSALAFLEAEMDLTLFVPNSDSSPLNSFVHLNAAHFADRTRRRLVGPEVAFWVYPSERARSAGTPQIRRLASEFGDQVLQKDALVQGKERLIVLEDFAGTGSDITKSLRQIERANLPVREVLVCLLVATEAAVARVRALCHQLSATSGRSYGLEVSLVLPHKSRCFGGPEPSYLDEWPSIGEVSEKIRGISERVFLDRLQGPLKSHNQHGFGNLALAFAFYSNCPDNTLPLIWATHGDWYPLFRRASRIL